MNSTVYLIDGYSIVYRSYFALVGRPLTNAAGANTSAVFGFVRFLVNLLRKEAPESLAVVLDPRGPTFRHQRYAEYKANRDRAPQDLHAQIPVIERILEAMGVPVLRVEGFEADDVMATVAETCSKSARSCAILSGDKDILQLLDDHVYVLEPQKGTGDYAPLRAAEVPERRGVNSNQIVDYLALIGDQSDNVPGVRGVGEKTAIKLLATWGTLEAIYANLDQVTPAGVRHKLEEGKESALLSRDLVTLRRDVALPLTLEELSLSGLNEGAAIPLLLEQGIRTIAAELGWKGEDSRRGEAAVVTPPAAPRDNAETQPAPIAARPAFPVPPPGEPRYEAVLSTESLDRWVEAVRRAGVFAYDCETDSLDDLEARPIGFSLSVTEGEACYIPLRASDAVPLSEAQVREALRSLLEDPGLKVVGAHLKYDYKVARRWGIRMAGVHFDTMVSAWLLDSQAASFGLDRLVRSYLGVPTLPYEQLIPKGDPRTLADLPLADVTRYAAEDADMALRVYHVLAAEIESAGLAPLLHDIEMPLLTVLGEMELRGIRLDPDPLRRYSALLEERVEIIDREIYGLCGHTFNINSTRQLQQVLFEERGLKTAKRTQTGFSTDNTVLELLAQDDRVAALVLDHRELTKLKSTYVDALPGLVRPDTGRIHTHFLQTGAATGRLASKDPNLQNIPVREESGRRVREAFVPQTGWLFLSADYSQIELVILAALSGDSILTESFRRGEDVHARTASLLFGMDQKDVGPDQRRIGKTINFGVIYGMSAFRLARDLRIPRRDADTFIERYFQTYGGVDAFIKRTVEEAERLGHVFTIMGRRREITGIRSRNRTERAAAERVAVNTRIQGSAADVVKKAMVALDRELGRAGLETRLLLQVHDELILEVPEGELETVRPVVHQTMERVVDLGIPLKVNLDAGSSWGSIH
jgi:DNA polymerase-1